VSKAIWARIRNLSKVKVSLGPVFPIKVISKWPAIMLAARRTANVPGRIMLLTVSIHTMKGIKTEGVP